MKGVLVEAGQRRGPWPHASDGCGHDCEWDERPAFALPLSETVFVSDSAPPARRLELSSHDGPPPHRIIGREENRGGGVPKQGYDMDGSLRCIMVHIHLHSTWHGVHWTAGIRRM